MFNEDFYPTPRSLCYKLTNGINWRNIKSVLEPGAGKGDLAEHVQSSLNTYHSRYEPPEVDCIEIVPELQAALKAKNFTVIHDDFLTFRTFKKYDLIIANFPFSQGARHAIHALRMIQKNGGLLRCIVNAETLLNQCTRERVELAEMIDDLCGDVDYLDDEFLHAERKTRVKIAVISVSVEIEERESILLDGLRASEFYDGGETAPADLVRDNYIEQLCATFMKEAALGSKLLEEYHGLKPYILDRIKREDDKSDHSSPLIEIKISGKDSYRSDSLTEHVNFYLRKLRRKYWAVLITDPRFTAQLTSKLREQLHAKLDELERRDFTMFNIGVLGKELYAQVNAGLNDAILALFDTLSAQWAWFDCSKNIHYYTGWKTNKAHKINKKVILPMDGFSAYSDKRYIDNYDIKQKLADMVKVFNMLAAEDASVSDTYRLVGTAIEESKIRKDFDLDLRYFEVKFYKKGTAHITFKNLDLLAKFNIYGSQRKNWLPPSYGKKPYNAMDREERQIVDEFQGFAEYSKVYANPDKFIVANDRPLLAAGIM